MNNFHYCEIFSDCFHCPVPFCPFEKLEDGMEAGGVETDDDLDEEGGDDDEYQTD